MIRKQRLRGGERVKVTFSLAAGEGDLPVSVVGDFNGWNPGEAPLRRRSPYRSAAIELAAGQRYSFRYLDSAGNWFGDDGADDFVANPFGGHDGVIDLTGAP